jgi:hypothetical protein
MENAVRLGVFLACLFALPSAAEETAPEVTTATASLQQLEAEGQARISDGRAVQREVDGIAARSRQLQDQFQAQLKLVQGLETYIKLLDQQLAGQADEIETLQSSITDVAVIERQILPLMTRMIDSLERFVELDVPFLREERRERVAGLRSLLGRSDVTVAEKCRRVFEAYQIENDYGRTIESYTDKLEVGGASFDAEFLRIGRLGLLYTTVGADRVGFWDADEGRWQPLDPSPWQRLIRDGLRVARQEVAPQLVSIPFDPAEVIQ